MRPAVPVELRRLARLYGIHPSFRDWRGRPRSAGTEALLAVLRARGAEVDSLRDVPAAVRARWHDLDGRRLPRCTVLAEGAAPAAEVRLEAAELDHRLDCRLVLEDGEVREWGVGAAELERLPGSRGRRALLPLPDDTPRGYHWLRVACATRWEAESSILGAPASAFRRGGEPRRWGVFAPVYALRGDRDLGVGTVGGLAALAEWVGLQGGSAVATLPLLAAFLDDPVEPSPYSPVSRLFWNELFLDVAEVAGAGQCDAFRERLDRPEVAAEAHALSRAGLVDYRRAAVLKRGLLRELADCFFGDGNTAELKAWIEKRPDVLDYARFRAAGESLGRSWREWPAPLRDGFIPEGRVDPESERYHIFTQWSMERQLAGAAETADGAGVGFHLDLPLGVHTDGYDGWRYPEAFVPEVSAGAPPDDFFAGGQDWGFQPLDPDGLREDGFSYLRGCLATSMRHAGALRVDHVMSLHRAYWIPRGHPATDGVYVAHHPAELYGVLALESRRHGTEVIGEDLGTVAPAVREWMRRHAFRRMYVIPFELRPDEPELLAPVPGGAVASLNTHDMEPFASFWRGGDISRRVELGFLDAVEAEAELGSRERLRLALAERLGLASASEPEELRDALLARLGASPAGIVLVSLCDLLLEMEPQNVPGTGLEHPNWRRRARYTLTELARIEEVRVALAELDRTRRHGLDNVG